MACTKSELGSSPPAARHSWVSISEPCRGQRDTFPSVLFWIGANLMEHGLLLHRRWKGDGKERKEAKATLNVLWTKREGFRQCSAELTQSKPKSIPFYKLEVHLCSNSTSIGEMLIAWIVDGPLKKNVYAKPLRNLPFSPCSHGKVLAALEWTPTGSRVLDLALARLGLWMARKVRVVGSPGEPTETSEG